MDMCTPKRKHCHLLNQSHQMHQGEVTFWEEIVDNSQNGIIIDYTQGEGIDNQINFFSFFIALFKLFT